MACSCFHTSDTEVAVLVGCANWIPPGLGPLVTSGPLKSFTQNLNLPLPNGHSHHKPKGLTRLS